MSCSAHCIYIAQFCCPPSFPCPLSRLPSLIMINCTPASPYFPLCSYLPMYIAVFICPCIVAHTPKADVFIIMLLHNHTLIIAPPLHPLESLMSCIQTLFCGFSSHAQSICTHSSTHPNLFSPFLASASAVKWTPKIFLPRLSAATNLCSGRSKVLFEKFLMVV